jgi:oligopeptide/dipeptide ABC transporter ATP-binding protein
LLSVRDLTKHFPIRKGLFSRTVGQVRAVDGVSFDLFPGETLGLVGESGCGKTTTGRCVLRLVEPTSGAVRFEGRDVLGMVGPANCVPCGGEMQIVFQDPYAEPESAPHRRQHARGTVGDPWTRQGAAARERVAELLDAGRTLAGPRAARTRHEFSGQRQRIGIARALAVSPRLIVLDEPVSALDVSIQAQIVNLLQDLQRDLGLTYLFVAHDLSVVEHISTRVAVMYLGRIVEVADRATLYRDPRHPYTKALLSAVPVPDPDRRSSRIVLPGDVPSPAAPPSGCRFHPRCPLAAAKGMPARCRTEDTVLREVAPGHLVACHEA